MGLAFMDELDATQLLELRKLANSSFDPGDYKGDTSARTHGLHTRCRICRVMHAPNGICGYCRGRVRLIREGM